MVDRLELAGLSNCSQQENLAKLLFTSSVCRSYTAKICQTLFFPNFVDDLLSETSVKILSASTIPNLNTGQVLLYLKTTILNTARRLVRKEISHQKKLKKYYDEVSQNDFWKCSTQTDKRKRNSSIVREAWKKLYNQFPEYQMLLQLKVAGATYKEMSRLLGIEENQAKYRVSKAKKCLKKVLEEAGYCS